MPTRHPMGNSTSLEEEFFQRTMGVQPTSRSLIQTINRISGYTFCFTGKLDSMGRREAWERIERSGGYISTSVTGATEILVAGSIPRTAIIAGELSRKLMKARETGKQIISEETFLTMLEDCGQILD